MAARKQGCHAMWEYLIICWASYNSGWAKIYPSPFPSVWAQPDHQGIGSYYLSGKTQFLCIFFRIWIKKCKSWYKPTQHVHWQSQVGSGIFFERVRSGRWIGRSTIKFYPWRGFRQGDVDVTLVERGAGSWCGSIGRDAAAGREGRHEGWDS
jgi:hypothetical protein